MSADDWRLIKAIISRAPASRNHDIGTPAGDLLRRAKRSSLEAPRREETFTSAGHRRTRRRVVSSAHLRRPSHFVHRRACALRRRRETARASSFFVPTPTCRWPVSWRLCVLSWRDLPWRPGGGVGAATTKPELAGTIRPDDSSARASTENMAASETSSLGPDVAILPIFCWLA